jgi:hypothetical protein
MQHIAVVVPALFAALILSGCGRGGVEIRLGMHEFGAGPGVPVGVAELPEGHPPVLPPGHPPVLPPGHPPIEGYGTRCPGSDVDRGWQPAPGRSAPRDAPSIIST